MELDEETKHWVRSKCQSPIESMLILAYIEGLERTSQEWLYCTDCQGVEMFKKMPDETVKTPLHLEQLDFICPQQTIGDYRADFVLGRIKEVALLIDERERVVLAKLPLIVIECDGHDYHERTKEQAAHDRSRDRKMQLDGFRVMRFTGSEIHRDVDACVDQIDEMFMALMSEKYAGRQHSIL